MDEQTVARMFDPFFTTKPPGHGTGLGMAMVYGLMKQHRGLVDVESALGRETTVRLYFPVLDRIAAPAEGTTQNPVLPRGTATILLAEDDPALRRTAKRALESCGYQVVAVEDGAHALAYYERHKADLDLIISDVVMPKLGGRELYHAVRADEKGIPFLFASGHSAADVAEREDLGHVPFLKKPWSLSDLANQVQAVLSGKSSP